MFGFVRGKARERSSRALRVLLLAATVWLGATSAAHAAQVDCSSFPPRALKKNDRMTLSFIVLCAWSKANFISVDFPVPGFPLTQRNP